MYFKEELLVELLLSVNHPFRFVYSKPRKAVLDFLSEPPKIEGTRGQAVCRAVLEWNPSDNVRKGFETLAGGGLPAGSKLPDSHTGVVDTDGRIEEGRAIPPSALPESLKSAIQQAARELHDLTAATVRAIRWRSDHRAAHTPINGTRGLFFSMDGSKWMSLVELHISVEVIGSVHLTEGARREIEEIVASNRTEPLGHDLHREAWEQRRTNPRSSLIIGIAAAEVGCKECISSLVPDARWLAENSPSPPLDHMLAEYIPLLPGKCTFEGKTLAPPDEIIKVVKKGVTMRNKVTHVGTQAIAPNTLDEVLLAVQDLLWLLDYYAGSAWALAYLRPEVRSKLAAA